MSRRVLTSSKQGYFVQTLLIFVYFFLGQSFFLSASVVSDGYDLLIGTFQRREERKKHHHCSLCAEADEFPPTTSVDDIWLTS